MIHMVKKSHSNNGFQNVKRPFLKNFSGYQKPINEVTPSLLVDAIDSLSANMEILSQNQKYIVRAQEKVADITERQVVAIEKMIAYLDIIPKQLVAQNATKPKGTNTQKNEIEIAVPVNHLEPVKPL